MRKILQTIRFKICSILFQCISTPEIERKLIDHQLASLLEKMIELYDYDYEIEDKLYEVLFDVKHRKSEHLDGKSPTALYNKFLEDVVEGRNTFIIHPFYKEIKAVGGREIRKIKRLIKIIR
jgi:hypothetical protein